MKLMTIIGENTPAPANPVTATKWSRWVFAITLFIMILGKVGIIPGIPADLLHKTAQQPSFVQTRPLLNAPPKITVVVPKSEAEPVVVNKKRSDVTLDRSRALRAAQQVERNQQDQQASQGAISAPAPSAPLPDTTQIDTSRMRATAAPPQRSRVQDVHELIPDVMKGILSVVLLIISSLIMLSPKYPETANKWATGTIGALVGFWLK